MKATFATPSGVDRHEVLGVDDVSDADLAAMVADLWDVDAVDLLDSTAEPVAYDVPSILTGARTWVRGHADAGAGPRGFTLFVKRVHHWRHSPAFVGVPPEIGEWAAATVPWRAEPLIYASDLADRLPDGLDMPRGLRVEEHPDETAVVWIEAVEADPVAWSLEDSARAARLLGRLSASPAVAPLAGIDPQPWHIDMFVAGRIGYTVLPGLHDDATWAHPCVAEHFGALRSDLEATARHLDVLAREFAASRHLASSTSVSGVPSRSASTCRSSSWATSRSAGRTSATCPSGPLPASRRTPRAWPTRASTSPCLRSAAATRCA
jgi:hypothetical protein